jgi:hypothetical protein
VTNVFSPPGMILLASLVPMHFSVRTPKGQRLNRSIVVNAPMWSLHISCGSKNNCPFTDIEFCFRGIQIVRRAIIAVATQYLEAEAYPLRGRDHTALHVKWSARAGRQLRPFTGPTSTSRDLPPAPGLSTVALSSDHVDEVHETVIC